MQQDGSKQVIGHVSSFTTMSSRNNELHRCYDLCSHWRGADQGCIMNNAYMFPGECKDFLIWEDIRIENKNW